MNTEQIHLPTAATAGLVDDESRIAGAWIAEKELSLLPGESEERFAALKHELELDLKPVGILEILLVEKIFLGFWRSRRLLAWEAAMEFANAVKLPEPFNSRLNARFQTTLARLQSANDTALFKTMDELKRIQRIRLNQERAALIDANRPSRAVDNVRHIDNAFVRRYNICRK